MFLVSLTHANYAVGKIKLEFARNSWIFHPIKLSKSIVIFMIPEKCLNPTVLWQIAFNTKMWAHRIWINPAAEGCILATWWHKMLPRILDMLTWFFSLRGLFFSNPVHLHRFRERPQRGGCCMMVVTLHALLRGHSSALQSHSCLVISMLGGWWHTFRDYFLQCPKCRCHLSCPDPIEVIPKKMVSQQFTAKIALAYNLSSFALLSPRP